MLYEGEILGFSLPKVESEKLDQISLELLIFPAEY